ncbi:MAG: long-chain fatty acid--CoA ligase [Haliea sp.]|uniref:class I adenylate-forming enzyme family protein n=1 Tax=Haliea sp. TaxID=1932666 RepID=UPI000C56364E|nr:class I adenylate-forming enzyme family protein [Haliea sp.]MBM68036.1 long-chain fatty acid--CoA ligase [Haliea sp.]|tara:strand:- start:35009 stop:36721 length:1713 start_codon:yes stop_codon:yes gene_type:complete
MQTSDDLFAARVAALTAPGQPFALETVTVGSVAYRSYCNMPRNLGQYCALMRQHGDRCFAVYREQRYSFEEAWAHSAALATALQQRFGVTHGDRVAIVSRNNPEWMLAFIAIVSIGAVAVPMNAWWTSEELDYGIEDSGSRVVIADPERVSRLAPIAARHALSIIAVGDCRGIPVESAAFDTLLQSFRGADMPEVAVAPDDDATIMYTSGSTGHPKGAVSTHRAILAALWSWLLQGTVNKQLAGATSRPPYPPAGLLTIPLFHCTASHSAFLLSLLVGRKLVIMHKWDAQEALRLIEAERITWFNGVPTMSAELQAAAAESAYDLASLAEIFSGGAARPPDQVGKIAGTFPGSAPGIGYGLTETNALGAVNAGAAYVARPSSTGRAVPAVTEFKVIDGAGHTVPAGERGELCIKSTANVRGYWNKPEATREAFVDGWFHTGDVACLDDEGFLYIVDRIKDIIIRGGENISCIEVEAALHRHPAVREAAVFGLPDVRLGETVGAVVTVRAGAALNAEQLQGFLREHLAAFKVPQRVWLQEQPLPRIASGKIFKRQLKAQYSAGLTQAAKDE